MGTKTVSKWWTTVLVAVAPACAPSVTVADALTPYAPIEARRAQYNRYRQVRTDTTVNRLPRSCGRYGCSPGAEIVYTQIRLANGAVVLNPADLLPLVARDSQTARHIQSARNFETAGIISFVSTIPLAAVGTGLWFGGGALGWNTDTTLRVSIPILVVAGLSAIAGGVFRESSAISQRAAFGTFDADFRDNLGLCVGPERPPECAQPSRLIKESTGDLSLSSPLAAGLSLRF